MPVVGDTNKVDLGDQTRLTRADVAGYDDVLTATDAADTYVAQADPVAYAARATIAHTDTAAKDLFTLPAGAVIIGIMLNITAAFDDTGTDLLDIGTSDTADQFVADFDASSTGMTLQPPADESAMSAATVVQGVYTGANGNAAAGAATITCLYIIP